MTSAVEAQVRLRHLRSSRARPQFDSESGAARRSPPARNRGLLTGFRPRREALQREGHQDEARRQADQRQGGDAGEPSEDLVGGGRRPDRAVRLRVLHVVQSARPHQLRQPRHSRRLDRHDRLHRCGGSAVEGPGFRAGGDLRAAPDPEPHGGRAREAGRRYSRASFAIADAIAVIGDN